MVVPGRLSIASSRGRFSAVGRRAAYRTPAPLATRASPSVEGRHEPVDGLASPAMTKGIRDQPGFSRPSRRAISASSDSRSAKGSSTFGGGLTLELAFAFLRGRAGVADLLRPVGRRRRRLLRPRDRLRRRDGALGAGTLAAGGVARGSAFAAATAESTFSERGGAPGDVGGGVDGLLPCADEDGWPGPDEDLGGPFSVRRAMGALIPDPLARGDRRRHRRTRRGGARRRRTRRRRSRGLRRLCGRRRGGRRGGGATLLRLGRPGRRRGRVCEAFGGRPRRGRAAGLQRRRQERAGQRAPERRRTQPRATKRRARRRPSSEALRPRPAQRRQPPRFAARARPARGEATADYSRAPAPWRG